MKIFRDIPGFEVKPLKKSEIMTKEEMIHGLKKRVVDLALEEYIEMYSKAEIRPILD